MPSQEKSNLPRYSAENKTISNPITSKIATALKSKFKPGADVDAAKGKNTSRLVARLNTKMNTSEEAFLENREAEQDQNVVIGARSNVKNRLEK